MPQGAPPALPTRFPYVRKANESRAVALRRACCANFYRPEPLTLVRAAGCAGTAVQIRRSWASGRMALGARLGECAGGLMFGYVGASQSVLSSQILLEGSTGVV